jgi:hypothetical protein
MTHLQAMFLEMIATMTLLPLLAYGMALIAYTVTQ